MHLVIAITWAAGLVLGATAKPCPPLGPVLPAPKTPSSSDAVKAAIQELTAELDAIASSTLNSSGLSVAVKSIHEDGQLFSYHHTPPNLSGTGTNKIDENTIYRVGSVSKIMPVLIALQSDKIRMDDSVLEYIPELRTAVNENELLRIQWEGITVRSLATHLSGLPSEMTQDLAMIPDGPWAEMGLPQLPNNAGPYCSGLFQGTKSCSNKELVTNLAKENPTFPSFTSPSYSNVAYALLGVVVENATGQKFPDAAKEHIFGPAGMESSSFNGPIEAFSKIGFVPKGESTWNITLGAVEAAGGMFSTTADMLAFNEAVYNNKLLSPHETRQWLEPQTHTSSFGMSIGASWEILRSDSITSDKRIVDFYTKGGDIGMYHCRIAIIPDYDITLVLLMGGPEVSDSTVYFNAIIKALIPAVEASGKSEASVLEGTYVEESRNSSLTLSSDSGGILISNFTVEGFDVLSNIDSYAISTTKNSLNESMGKSVAVEGRLYPTKRQIKDEKLDTTKTAWRAVFDSMTQEEKDYIDSELFIKDGSCQTMYSLDRKAYNFHSLAEFAVVENADGEVEAIINWAFNVTLTKTGSA